MYGLALAEPASLRFGVQFPGSDISDVPQSRVQNKPSFLPAKARAFPRSWSHRSFFEAWELPPLPGVSNPSGVGFRFCMWLRETQAGHAQVRVGMSVSV